MSWQWKNPRYQNWYFQDLSLQNHLMLNQNVIRPVFSLAPAITPILKSHVDYDKRARKKRPMVNNWTRFNGIPLFLCNVKTHVIFLSFIHTFVTIQPRKHKGDKWSKVAKFVNVPIYNYNLGQLANCTVLRSQSVRNGGHHVESVSGGGAGVRCWSEFSAGQRS